MERRSFAAGVLAGAILAAAAYLGAASAVQSEGTPGTVEGRHVIAGQDLAFVTTDPHASPVTGQLMVRVDGAWRETIFEVRMVPAR